MGQRVEKLHRCRGLVGYYATATTADATPEPQVIREKVATQMWRERVDRLQRNRGRAFFFRGNFPSEKIFRWRNVKKDG